MVVVASAPPTFWRPVEENSMTLSEMLAKSPLKTRNVTAVLGPTNTGKTHLAIERMVSHKTGIIGLPLRLLAREVYDRVVAKVGVDAVALITGEERIKPDNPRFWVCTVEAMPRDIPVEFLAIDEIQLAADLERGHVFTERLFYARGMSETLLLGAGTMRETIREILPGANFVSRPRLSKLTYAGQKKLSRLPRRTAVVAFSQAEVYEIAELMRRQRGGAAVVLGALSPRTRNAQVAMYQNGDVDYLVATDAIGMGLNLDVEHVAFAGSRKFDGRSHRELSPAELAQIAGRAGRHMKDGTFGVTGDVEPFPQELIEKLEQHEFEPVKTLQWRSSALDFSSVDKLKDSLREIPDHPRLTRARQADDVIALDHLSGDEDIARRATNRETVSLLWDVCQVPDYRKISPAAHAELVGQVYKYVSGSDGKIPEDWFAEQVNQAAKTDGDIDTLSTRLAHIRTWTFVSNRAAWLKDPEHWQARTREIEDTLSDALHEQLTQRFVDKRTSTLVKRLRDDDDLEAEIRDDGSVHVEKHFVGKLSGFLFAPENVVSDSLNAKAARSASVQVLGKEMAMRARRVASAKSDAFKLQRVGAKVLWKGEEIARLDKGEDALKPSVILICDEHLALPDKEKVQARLNEWLSEIIQERLKPLVDLGRAEDITGLARGIAFQMRENFGILKREAVTKDVRELDQESRGQLRKYGVRFGAFNLFIPILLKPAAIDLLVTLWMLKNAERVASAEPGTLDSGRPGLTSVPANVKTPEDFYRVCGFHLCGPRAVRVDMLERLSDMIRPLIAFRLNEAAPEAPPKGSSGDGGFIVLPNMMSILGCSSGELSEVLKALGFRSEMKPKPKAVEPVAKPAEAAEVTAVTEVTVTEVTVTEFTEITETTETDTTEAAAEAAEAVADAAEAAAETVSAETEAAESVTEASDVASESSAPAAMATEVVAGTEGAADAPAPDMIEVWRPRRRRDEQPERRREGGEGRRPYQGNRNRNPRPGQGQPAVAAATADGTTPVTAEAGADGQPSKDREGGERRPYRGDRNRDRSNDRTGAPRRDAGPGADTRPPRDGDRPHRGRDGDRTPRRDTGREGHRDTRREEKRAAYDPSSPFAALSALKQQLEDSKR
jgi:ATP-dependent RNA helicase SUPV3L1/SUV3